MAEPGRPRSPGTRRCFRGDQLAAALAEIAPVALRYGATSYASTASATTSTSSCRRATFEDKLDWERYWYGPEFIALPRASTRAGTRCRSCTPPRT